MPCEDTTSLMLIRVDHNDYLIDYDYTKISCDKKIGDGISFHKYCEGKKIQNLVNLNFYNILRDMGLENKSTENQFLVYLEWSALRSALIQYLGEEEDVDTEHYEVASIQYDDNKVQINQIVRPMKNLPKIESCFQRARQATL
ncbi:MAG: hypothetical protein GWO41_11500 [candidate division Zixibacteria bacterium]|nr:hypothetical protein [candidate division Zixibacteria bacterium]NIX59970.1 hypothetical protein [candidate division Zixibacteria bacterium]